MAEYNKKKKNEFVKNRLNLSSKSTRAANAHFVKSLLDNWLKNNHITRDIIVVCFRASLITFNFFAMDKSSHVYNLPAALSSCTLLSFQSACILGLL